MIRTLAEMEWKRLFRSPLGWVVLAAAQLGQGLVFVQLVETYQRNPAAAAHNGVTYQVASLALASSGYIALLAIPLISMRLISEERRLHSLALLQSSPLSSVQIIMGKYLGLCAYAILLPLLSLLMALSLIGTTQLDFGMLASATIGSILLICAYAAIGLFCSSSTRSPALAAISCLTILILLWSTTVFHSGIRQLDKVMQLISWPEHLQPMLQGVIDTRNLFFFLFVIILFLGLSVLQLENLRNRGEGD